jgi:hypothetical protein
MTQTRRTGCPPQDLIRSLQLGHLGFELFDPTRVLGAGAGLFTVVDVRAWRTQARTDSTP